MMEPIYVIGPDSISDELSSMINSALCGHPQFYINENSILPDLKGKRIIFAVELNSAGYCIPVYSILSELLNHDINALLGSIGMLLIKSSSELYTKSAAQNIILIANQLGCSFIGHPVVEAVADFNNFSTWQKTIDMPLYDICIYMCKKTGTRLLESNLKKKNDPEILVLHASIRETSNTLQLWNMVKDNIKSSKINEIHVENGTIHDCIGCSFKTCSHYSKQNSCFYGGYIIEEVMPSIEKADAIIWICPNYNDALSANLTAVINRMTALYRKISFNDKTIFSIIVSGNSGSDSVAKQLIGALNINKGFILPQKFYIQAIANNPGSVKKIPGIYEKAKIFSKNIIENIKCQE